MKTFEEVLKINVNNFTEKKNNLTYLSWAHAWTEFKKVYPEACYKVIKDENGKPFFSCENLGIMCYTEVTVGNLTHEMWLPVMDGANKSMKFEGYEYSTRYGNKTVSPASMFDVNKTIMRCLVKNLAMFGLGLYIYACEDLPETTEPVKPVKPVKPILKNEDFKRAVDTIKAGKYSAEELKKKFNLNEEQQKTILNLKTLKNGK